MEAGEVRVRVEHEFNEPAGSLHVAPPDDEVDRDEVTCDLDYLEACDCHLLPVKNRAPELARVLVILRNGYAGQDGLERNHLAHTLRGEGGVVAD